MEFLLTPKPVVKPWTGCHGDLHLNNVVLNLFTPPPSGSHAYIHAKALPCIKIIDFEMSAVQSFTETEILSYEPGSRASITKHFLDLTVDEKDAFEDDIDKLKDMLLYVCLTDVDANLEEIDAKTIIGLDPAYVHQIIEILGDQQDIGNALSLCKRWLDHEGYQKLPSNQETQDMRDVCRRAMGSRPIETDVRRAMDQYLVNTPEEEDEDHGLEVEAFLRITGDLQTLDA